MHNRDSDNGILDMFLKTSFIQKQAFKISATVLNVHFDLTIKDDKRCYMLNDEQKGYY